MMLAANIPAFDVERLVAQLVAEGLVDSAALGRARRVSMETGERLDRVITSLGLVAERPMAERVASIAGLPLVAASDYPDQPLHEERLAGRFLRKANALPLADTEGGLLLAMVDPFDEFTRRAVALAVGRPVLPRLALPADLDAAFERLYGGAASAAAQGDLPLRDEGIADTDVARLKDLASEAPVIRLVNQLIAWAIDQRASDIHLEPFETHLSVRYRIDGLLQEQESLARGLAPAVVSRLKLMARLDVAERRLPQDGRMKSIVRGKEIDFRVATAPTLHGESMVLRILDRDAVPLDFEALGLGEPQLPIFLAQLARPNGIVLVTGPTGSGKTTTLYAALSRLNSSDRKILTAEDPVEYQLAGINQVQVKPDIGLSFAHVLRAALRHDPDILMVGEIRDLETAQIAIQAALTGHLVLSTVHTNSAAATIVRLLDLGVPDYLLTATVCCIVAQRLVRVLCRSCREPYQIGARQAEDIGLAPGSTLYRARGCDACRGSGYVGRIGLYEVMALGDGLRKAVHERVDGRQLHGLALEGGMRSLYQDGIAKSVAGLTTLEEVWRVTADR